MLRSPLCAFDQQIELFERILNCAAQPVMPGAQLIKLKVPGTGPGCGR
jgi:hypothetical protein